MIYHGGSELREISLRLRGASLPASPSPSLVDAMQKYSDASNVYGISLHHAEREQLHVVLYEAGKTLARRSFFPGHVPRLLYNPPGSRRDIRDALFSRVLG